MNDMSVRVYDDVTLVVHCEGIQSESIFHEIKEELERYFGVDDTSPMSIPEKIEQLREKYNLESISIRGGT
jgi:hypothetical protein